MAANPILTAANEVMALVMICAEFGDPVDVDDGEVAEEEHGDRHDEAGDLSEQRSDHGCGGSGGGRWRSVDRKDALQHLPCPVVTRIEGRPADVEGRRARGGCLREGRVGGQAEKGEGEREKEWFADGHGRPPGGWPRVAETGANTNGEKTPAAFKGPPAQEIGRGEITARNWGLEMGRADRRLG